MNFASLRHTLVDTTGDSEKVIGIYEKVQCMIEEVMKDECERRIDILIN